MSEKQLAAAYSELFLSVGSETDLQVCFAVRTDVFVSMAYAGVCTAQTKGNDCLLHLHIV